jgi:hypothetical protein
MLQPRLVLILSPSRFINSFAGTLSGKDISMQLQHNRKDDTMKYNIILTNKMNQLCVFILPVRLPVFTISLPIALLHLYNQ